MRAVRQVLEEVGATDVPLVEVYNKCDALTPDERRRLQEQDPAALCISALRRRRHRRAGRDDRLAARARRPARDADVRSGRPGRSRADRPGLPAWTACSSRRPGTAGCRSWPTCPAVSSAISNRARGSRIFLMRKLGSSRRCVAAGSACAPKTVPPPPSSTTPEVPRVRGAADSGGGSRTRRPHWPKSAAGASCRPATSRAPSASSRPRSRPRPGSIRPTFRSDISSWPANGSQGGAAAFRPRARAAADDVAALVGRGQALLALNREGEALAAFEAALAADPSLTDIARRVEVLKFRHAAGAGLARARRGARRPRRRGRRSPTRPRSPASPDSPFLYRELAGVERQKGDADAALEHFRKAVALDPGDARSLVQIGEILEGRGDFDGAAKAYGDALAIEPNADVEARIASTRARGRARAAAGGVPRHRSGAADHARRSRGAHRRAARAAAAGEPPPRRRAHHRRPQPLGGDAGSWRSRAPASWSRSPTTRSSRGTIVRRVDLAQAVSRLLARIARAEPAAPGETWEAARLKFRTVWRPAISPTSPRPSPSRPA